MSLKLQQQKMKEISSLLSQNLSYIYGERESGSNGAKKEFLRKSADFLRNLGKDLEFSHVKVTANKAGIACSGEVTLYGMWNDGNGIYFEISQLLNKSALLYREIKSLNDFSGGRNQWISLSIFEEGNYQQLCDIFFKQRKMEGNKHAA